MLLRLQNAYASMHQMVREQERTANNLANANTVGFKRSRTFTEVLTEKIDAEQAPRSDRRTAFWDDLTQGELDKTDNPLDVALSGEGFFVLTDETTDTTRFTRAGLFALDSEGRLRNAMGWAVEGESGPIQVPDGAGPIEIALNGEISAGGQTFGKLRVVTFETPEQLQRMDGSTFGAGNQDPLPAETAKEMSNVNTIDEMTSMIQQHRLFESQHRALRTTDDVLSTIVRDLGKF